MTDDSRKALREKGLKIRREVLGSKYVDNALNNATDFNRPLQDLLNEFCWGGAWGREGLTRKERSMINLAMLTALGRTHEVETHVRGALNNGLTQQQIAEVLLQTAIYCGVPAAVDSFRAATKVIAEETAAGKQSAGGKAPGTSGAPAGGIGPGPDTAPAR
jgi:4-carboxymuconolactone decarboxylase